MITESELKISNESYTHKDFYQIYPEILDLVKNITERWDPASSNESDPGVVLLKLLAFVGDKLNYNIDKNILECFMPSATQEDSMRKLCDMMGYDMHYYVSAATYVSFMWIGDHLVDTSEASTGSIKLPRFTTCISNSNQENVSKKVSYVLTEPVELSYRGEVKRGLAIEGICIDFPINSDNIVRLSNLDDAHRLYFPESQIAENGVWIYSALDETDMWQRSKNLNIDVSDQGNKYWKFCFDSKRKLPYIQFPENVADLIGEGLRIKYVRTSGVNGNIPAKTLDTLDGATTVTFYPLSGDPEELPIEENGNKYLVIQNTSFTQSGQDVETLDDAYEGFKKTIGTFDTLVTCRDYANAIYNLVRDPINAIPYVSNVQVSDIRDDINYSYKIATFDDFGILYEDTPLKVMMEDGPTELIDHFDIFLYPLNPVSSLYSSANYRQTFLPLPGIGEIMNSEAVDDYKTISHNLKQVSLAQNSDLIYLIKNYYHLKAQIATTYKVSKAEGLQILNNIYFALFQKFNARKLDYGEEIPYSTILETMQQADTRIKYVSLSTDLDTAVMLSNGEEKRLVDANVDDSTKALRYKLIAKNVLAGRVPLFKYRDDFAYTFGQRSVSQSSLNKTFGAIRQYYVDSSTDTHSCSITAISTDLNIPAANVEAGYKLLENESIQFYAKNIGTKLTYPVSVNYYYVGYVTQDSAGPEDVPENVDYKLPSADTILYINYTDSDGVKHSLKYTGGDNPTYTEMINSGVEGEPKAWSGIIRTNFALKDSGTLSNSANRTSYKRLSITSGFPSSWNIPGMYTLLGTDQIEIRDFIAIDFLGGSSLKCYWITNNNNLLKLNKVVAADNSSYWYEYTFSTNEYFFYTDALNSSLATFGAGTTLKYFDSTRTDDFIILPAPTRAVDLDQVGYAGIGAFADTAWYIWKLVPNSQSLTLQENQLITLGKGSKISGLNKDLTSNWVELSEQEAASVAYDGVPLPVFKNIDNPWHVRTVLNINIGPDNTMALLSDPAAPQVLRKVTFFTSGWKTSPYASSYETVTDSTDLSKLYEEIITTANKEVVIFDNSQDSISIRANKQLQVAGGHLISVHTYSSSGILQDDLKVYPYIATPCSFGDSTASLDSFDGHYTKIALKDLGVDSTTGELNKIVLPTYIPEDSFGLVMIYYIAGQTTGESGEVLEVKVMSTKAGELLPAITDYRENIDGSKQDVDKYPLEEGINIIRISQSCNLEITSTDADGSVTFSNISIVERTSQLDNTGVNLELLGIPDATAGSTTEATLFVQKLLEMDYNKRFYFNLPISNYIKLDVDTLDAASWFNPNNICNKFVLGEIDTNFDDISIEASSRLGKW